eukprot:6173494-Pleurochrysis_carterae.AAC.4
MIASLVPNTHTVDDDSQSWSTESRESEKEGTQRTFRRIRCVLRPLASIAQRGMSPIAVHCRDLPSHAGDQIRA